MKRFLSHPELSPQLYEVFCQQHKTLFEEAEFIAVNNEQVVKSFSLDGQEYIIKRYPDKGPRGALRSGLAISRSANSFKMAARLNTMGVQSPHHLFLARHIGVLGGTSYLVMAKSAGVPLESILEKSSPLAEHPHLLKDLAAMVKTIHREGLCHGDLHAGNIFILPDDSVEVIDLDNMRPSSKQEKDKNRLIRSFRQDPNLGEVLKDLLV